MDNKTNYRYVVDYTIFIEEDGDNVPIFKFKSFEMEEVAISFAKKASKADVSAFAMASVERYVEELDEYDDVQWVQDSNYETLEFNDGQLE